MKRTADRRAFSRKYGRFNQNMNLLPTLCVASPEGPTRVSELSEFVYCRGVWLKTVKKIPSSDLNHKVAVDTSLWFLLSLPDEPTDEESEEAHRLLDWIVCVIDGAFTSTLAAGLFRREVSPRP